MQKCWSAFFIITFLLCNTLSRWSTEVFYIYSHFFRMWEYFSITEWKKKNWKIEWNVHINWTTYSRLPKTARNYSLTGQSTGQTQKKWTGDFHGHTYKWIEIQDMITFYIIFQIAYKVSTNYVTTCNINIWLRNIRLSDFLNLLNVQLALILDTLLILLYW